MIAWPAGYVYIRPDTTRATRTRSPGLHQLPDYPFPILDPDPIITIPIRNITAPRAGRRGTEVDLYLDRQTWPQVKA